jgi:hypothetical protein
VLESLKGREQELLAVRGTVSKNLKKRGLYVVTFV